MRFYEAIDQYVRDQWDAGRFTSKNSERRYLMVLSMHAEDSQLRDPRQTTRDDVKRTLRRWPNPNTQAGSRSILVSFYDWMMEEGYRPDNPARQTRRPKMRAPNRYRMTAEETQRLLAAAFTTAEKRIVYLGVCAGLRASELRGLQGRHFEREGFVWVSADIAKGGKERFVPIIRDLAGVVGDIRRNVEHDEYVIPVTRNLRMRNQVREITTSDAPPSYNFVLRRVQSVSQRAHIAANITPHTMRHAFADHIARQVEVRIAQAALGHSNVATTQGYLSELQPEDLAAAMSLVSISDEGGH